MVVPWLRQSVADLSSRRFWFDPDTVHVISLTHARTFDMIFSELFRLSPRLAVSRSKAWVCGPSFAETGGFESRRWHAYLYVMNVVCCQVEVSATSPSLDQMRSPKPTRAVEPQKNFSLSLSALFHQCSRLIFNYLLLLPEGQTVNSCERSHTHTQNAVS
jgi:hypothetical protein